LWGIIYFYTQQKGKQLKVYILRATDGIDDYIIGVYATRVLAENVKSEEDKKPHEDWKLIINTEHEVIEK